MANKITGKITFVSNTYSVSTQRGSFNKREFWVAPMYFDRYTGEPTAVSDEFSCPFELTHERCALLDGYKVGDAIVVTFDLRGRVVEKDGNKSCFNTNDARMVEPYAKPVQQPSVEVAVEQSAPAPSDNGLPF